MFSTKPLPGNFGVEIEGLDLRQPLEPAVLKSLLDVFHQNQVMVLRNQALEFEDFDRVSREFGDQKPHFLDHLRLRGHAAILMLTNLFEDGKPLGVYEGAAFWHTDVAFQDHYLQTLAGDPDGYPVDSMCHDFLLPWLRERWPIRA